MKNPCLKLRLIRVALTILLLAGTTAVVRSQTSLGNPITIKVNTDNFTTYASTNKNVKIEMRTEKLEITLQNTTSQSYSDLTLRYCIFDKDVHSQKIAVALQHETPVTLAAHVTLTLTSEVASIIYTPTHSTPSTSQKAGAKESTVKASGKEFAGYGVEVRQGNQAGGQYFGPQHSTAPVLGQLFTSLDLTNQFNAPVSSTHTKKAK